MSSHRANIAAVLKRKLYMYLQTKNTVHAPVAFCCLTGVRRQLWELATRCSAFPLQWQGSGSRASVHTLHEQGCLIVCDESVRSKGSSILFPVAAISWQCWKNPRPFRETFVQIILLGM